jgi:aldose 1-epimerase
VWPKSRSVAEAAQVAALPWGVTAAGIPVGRALLRNAGGMSVEVGDFGASLLALAVPDRAGRSGNIVLGLPTLADYEASRRRLGPILGRYAGRIGGARYTLDGRTVVLPPGPGGPALHGGPDGFDRRVWARRDWCDGDGAHAAFSLLSPDGDQGFPGALSVEVRYHVPHDASELHLVYTARTDAPTVLNLTSHAFFNLAGAGHAGLGTHRFRIAASRVAATDTARVPTGRLDGVAGTPFDFRSFASAAQRIAAQGMDGYDHSYLFDRDGPGLLHVATVKETLSGRRMDVLTTEPSAQFFTGNGFDGSETGREGRAYRRHDGFAFETQHLPDSPNHAHFPATALYPGQEWRSHTVLRFSVD